jgi:hypothetical protein
MIAQLFSFWHKIKDWLWVPPVLFVVLILSDLVLYSGRSGSDFVLTLELISFRQRVFVKIYFGLCFALSFFSLFINGFSGKCWFFKYTKFAIYFFLKLLLCLFWFLFAVSVIFPADS